MTGGKPGVIFSRTKKLYSRRTNVNFCRVSGLNISLLVKFVYYFKDGVSFNVAGLLAMNLRDSRMSMLTLIHCI